MEEVAVLDGDQNQSNDTADPVAYKSNTYKHENKGYRYGRQKKCFRLTLILLLAATIIAIAFVALYVRLLMSVDQRKKSTCLSPECVQVSSRK